jgi:hypothetical protein
MATSQTPPLSHASTFSGSALAVVSDESLLCIVLLFGCWQGVMPVSWVSVNLYLGGCIVGVRGRHIGTDQKAAVFKRNVVE